jgi:hypothetical protein
MNIRKWLTRKPQHTSLGLTQSPTSTTATQSNPTEPRFAFGVRFRATGAETVMDVYGDPYESNYPSQILRGYKLGERSYALQHGAAMRTTPPFFTSCSNCKELILTNREPRSSFRCGNCEDKTVAMEVRSTKLDVVLEEIDLALEKERLRDSEVPYILIVQPSSDEFCEQIRRISEQTGFKIVPNDKPVVGFLVLEAINRQHFSRGRPVQSFEKTIHVECTYSGETPPEIQRLSESLRQIDPQVRSFSTDLPEPTDPTQLLALGEHEAALEAINRELLSDPQNIELLTTKVAILIVMRRLEEASILSQTVVDLAPDDPQAWTVRGQVEDGKKNPHGAIECYERVLTLDPTDTHAMELLALNYWKIGKTDKASEYKTKLRSLGGYYTD